MQTRPVFPQTVTIYICNKKCMELATYVIKIDPQRAGHIDFCDSIHLPWCLYSQLLKVIA